MRAHRLCLTTAFVAALTCGGQLPLYASGKGYNPAQYLLANVKEGTSQEKYLANLLASFAAADANADGFDSEDIARIEESELAKAQRRYEQQIDGFRYEMKTLDKNGDGAIAPDEMLAAMLPAAPPYARERALFERLDTNADGELSREEIRQYRRRFDEERFQAMDADDNGGLTFAEMSAQAERQHQDRVRQAEQLAAEASTKNDLDGDGLVTFEELISSVPKPTVKARDKAKRERLFTRLMAIDTDGDGRVTEDELSSRFTEQFALVDIDQDGVISKEEAKAARLKLDLAREITKTAVCKLPEVPAHAVPIAVFSREGAQVSSVALGTQKQTTSIIDVTIEDGEEPLFILLASQEPVIWAFAGATQRVHQAVLFARKTDEQGGGLIGATGLAEGQVTIGETDCLPTAKILSLGPRSFEQLAPLFVASTGIEANIQKHRRGTISVSLPSFAVDRSTTETPAPDGFDPLLWNKGLSNYSRGIGKVDPASLITEASHQPYDVYPREFGLAQLAARGIIETTQHLNEYRIVKPLDTFPQSILRTGRVHFVLGEGITRPQGEIGSSCIYGPDGTTVLEGDYCTQYPKGNAVTVRVGDAEKACLVREDGTHAGCFPKDGRALRAVEAEGDAVTFEPVPESEEPIETVPSIPSPAPPDMYLPIDLIPAGPSQRW